MTRSLWIDEILTYERARLPLADLFKSNYYPLAYYLGHLTLQWGDTEFLFRLPCLIAGLVAVWLMYFLGRACHGRLVGLVASFLLAFNSLHIFFSQEARFYGYMTLAAIFCLWMLVRITQGSQNWMFLWGLTLSIILGSLSHPFFLPFLACAGFGAFFAVLLKPNWRGRRIAGETKLAFFSILGLFPLAFIYWRESHFAIANLVNTRGAEQRHYLMTWEGYWVYLKRMLLFQDRENAGLALALMFVGVLILILRRRWQSLPVLVVPLLMVPPFIVIPVTHWFNEKYFIAILPTLLIFVAVAFVEITRGVSYLVYRFSSQSTGWEGVRRWVTAGFLSGFLLFLSLELFTVQYYGKDIYASHWRVSWKPFAENMSSQMTGEDIIVHYAPPQYNPYAHKQLSFEPTPYSFDFYLRRQVPRERGDLYPTKHFLTGKASELDQWLRQYPNSTFWLVHWITEPMLPLSKSQEPMFQLRTFGYGNMLMVAGRPTQNYISNGDLFSTGVTQLRILGSARLQQVYPERPEDTCLTLSALPQETDFGVQFPLVVKRETLTTSTGFSFDPGQKYVMSMKLRFADIPGNSVTRGSLEVALIGRAADGSTARVLLHDLQGQSDWLFHSFPISMELYPEIYTATDISAEVLVRGSAGTLSIDKVQLERGERPSPFTEVARLPHDRNLNGDNDDFR